MHLRVPHLAAAAALAAIVVTACGYPDPNPDTGPAATTNQTTPTPAAGADDFNEGASKTPIKFPDGLQIVDLKVGDGATVPPGATVMANYTGWLASNGNKFDSSRDPGRQPICAILSSSAQQQGNCFPLIAGWNEGVPGMKVGGRRKLIIPPKLGYGDQGAPPTIPAGATLVFTVELMSITSTATPTPSPPPSPSPQPSSSPNR
ncbi:MAG TPA: FKBP-type peptidyl-prolyl cis-trans isomerase [Candidatus Dormibacteraeota bacterium]|nr:FKBP-type peptidyl-prolyl cis-trans isomerase [Candidatus Dormibacteraeota bacterium]